LISIWTSSSEENNRILLLCPQLEQFPFPKKCENRPKITGEQKREHIDVFKLGCEEYFVTLALFWFYASSFNFLG
jgi:hypothetical protein